MSARQNRRRGSNSSVIDGRVHRNDQSVSQSLDCRTHRPFPESRRRLAARCCRGCRSRAAALDNRSPYHHRTWHPDRTGCSGRSNRGFSKIVYLDRKTLRIACVPFCVTSRNTAGRGFCRMSRSSSAGKSARYFGSAVRQLRLRLICSNWGRFRNESGSSVNWLPRRSIHLRFTRGLELCAAANPGGQSSDSIVCQIQMLQMHTRLSDVPPF